MRHRPATPGDVRVARLGRASASAGAPGEFGELSAQGEPGELTVLVQLRGSAELTNGRRTVTASRGDVIAFVHGREQRIRQHDDSDALVVHLPRRAIPGLDDAIAGPDVILRAADSALLPIVVPFARHFADHVDDLAGPAAQQLFRGAARMLAAALLADPPEPVDALSAVRAYIDENLGCAELTPAVVARANYLSVRALHALFATTGGSVSAWIRNRRLDACRADLADDGFAHRTIADIALARGLADPAHFSRLFVRRFGVTPSAYRSGRHRAGDGAAVEAATAARGSFPDAPGDPLSGGRAAATTPDRRDAAGHHTEEHGGARSEEADDGAVHHACPRRGQLTG
ncbi:helix-turn-helix domain-containing protein [Leifsonia lichenia]